MTIITEFCPHIVKALLVFAAMMALAWDLTR